MFITIIENFGFIRKIENTLFNYAIKTVCPVLLLILPCLILSKIYAEFHEFWNLILYFCLQQNCLYYLNNFVSFLSTS